MRRTEPNPQIEENFISIDDVAAMMGTTANTIRQQAREDPTMLGFPVCVLNHRVLIPRKGFMHWMEFGVTRC